MKTTVIKPHKSSLGLDANVLSGLMYLAPFFIWIIPLVGYVAWVIPIVIFFLEKDSKFVKFHAAIDIVIMIISVIVGIIFSIFIWAATPRIPRDIEGAINFYIMGGASANLGLIAFLGAISLIWSLLILALVIYLAIMAFTYKQVELPFIGPLAVKLSGTLENISANQQKGNKTKPRKTTKKKNTKKDE